MFWIALVAQIVAPVPENPTDWISGHDTPLFLIRRHDGSWQVPIRIDVAPDGTVRSCDVEKTSGIDRLNKYTCSLLMRRAKFKPARIEGIPSFGVHRTTIRWVVTSVPRDTSNETNPDAEVIVERLPTGLESPALVKVIFVVDPAGNKSSCKAAETMAFEGVQNHPALVPMACEQIIKQYRATPAKDATGKPIPSVQNGLVRFSASQIGR